MSNRNAAAVGTERVAREAERIAKEAALARVRVLEAELRLSPAGAGAESRRAAARKWLVAGVHAHAPYVPGWARTCAATWAMNSRNCGGPLRNSSHTTAVSTAR